MSFRYRDDMEASVRDLNLQLRLREKMAIVGRTGAGKTSISLGLSRLIDRVSGQILLDGEDRQRIPLRELRRRVCVIPQHPFIFEGNLRENLDPYGEYQDEQVLECMRRSALDTLEKFKQRGLLTPISQSGSNLSLGEKQIISITRVLLKNRNLKGSLVVIDEPTSNIDVQMEKIITRTIDEHFKDSAVIVIAHKINTIMRSDVICVVDKGRIVERGDPRQLKRKENSIFNHTIQQIRNAQVN